MSAKNCRLPYAMLAMMFFGGLTSAAGPLSPQEGARLHGKLDAIAKNGASNPAKSMRTAITENEANSYLRFNLKERIPKGLANPEIQMLESGQLAGRVWVDIDEFKRNRQSHGFIDPLNYLSGQVPVTARGALRTAAGRGQFQIAAAEIMGVPLPKPIVKELVTYFSRSPEHPAGFDMDAPFNLPANIREVITQRGEAVVVQ